MNEADARALVGRTITLLLPSGERVTTTVTGLDIEGSWGPYVTTSSGRAFPLGRVTMTRTLLMVRP